MSKQGFSKICEKLIWIGLLSFVFFSPFSVAGAQAGIIIALLFWLVKMGITRKLDLVFTPLNLPILFYLIFQLLSALFSPFLGHSLKALREEWLLLIYFLVVNNIKDKESLKKLVFVLILVTTFIGVYALVQHYIGYNLYEKHPLEKRGDVFVSLGFFSHHLTYGGYVMLVFLIVMGIFLNLKTELKLKALYGVSALILGLALISSYARSAWLGALVGVLILGFLKGKKYALILSLGLIVLIFLLFVLDPSIWQRAQETMAAFSDEGQSTRLRLWHTSWNMIKSRPFLGIGLGNFGLIFDQYKVPGFYDTTCHPHNDYLNVAVNSGILGLLAYLWIWIVCAKSSLKRIISYNSKTTWDYSLMTGMFSGMFAFLVASLFQCYFTDAEFNMLLMFVVSTGMWIIIGKEREVKDA